MKIDLVIGTRPNIIKAGPLYAALRNCSWCQPRIVFLMQHTDPELSTQVLEDLGIPNEAILNLPLESSGYGARLGEMMAVYAREMSCSRPDLVVVFGDVDATLAAAYAAKRAHIPLAHVEAGLRSHDREMPEELNRLMVDAIADFHFTTSEDAVQTLVEKEGHSPDQVHFVGNLMIDALLHTVDQAHGLALCSKYGVMPGQFALATFHRPSNVDSREALSSLLDMLRESAKRLPVLLPLHPRTSAAMKRHGLSSAIHDIQGLQLLPPLRYRDFVSLLSCARLAMTDSGGIQEETTVLGIPCLTVRENTERPITLEQGSNRLVKPRVVAVAIDALLLMPACASPNIPGWDGQTALRILQHLQPT